LENDLKPDKKPYRPTSIAKEVWAGLLIAVMLVVLGFCVWAMVAHQSDVLSGLVALGTFALALGTVWLILDGREARRDENLERDAAYFRAALIEQVELCRHWYVGNPRIKGENAALLLFGWSPRFEALTKLLSTTSVPGPLSAYLVWLMARVQDHNNAMVQPLLNEARKIGASAIVPKLGAFTEQWQIQLDYLQLIVWLLDAEAARRGLGDVAAAFNPRANWLPWLIGEPRPKRDNDQINVVNQRYWNAPPWPTDQAYQWCSPAARDELSLRQRERVRLEISQTMRMGEPDHDQQLPASEELPADEPR